MSEFFHLFLIILLHTIAMYSVVHTINHPLYAMAAGCISQNIILNTHSHQ